MTDNQQKIVQALRQSNAALTQAELANATGQPAAEVAKDCYALGAQGVIQYRGGFYSLVRR